MTNPANATSVDHDIDAVTASRSSWLTGLHAFMTASQPATAPDAEIIGWQWSGNGHSWCRSIEGTEDRARDAAREAGVTSIHVRPLRAVPKGDE